MSCTGKPADASFITRPTIFCISDVSGFSSATTGRSDINLHFTGDFHAIGAANNLLAAMLLAGHPLRAQWVVSDPSNLAQGIVNSTKQVVEASRNGSTLLQSFQQTVKIYEQSKKYYDALRSVHNLVKSARRVQQTMLLVGDISDIYISNFRSMLDDTNYSAEELTAMAAGYTKLLSASADLLNDLKQIITPSGLSMTDKERLDIIDRIYYEMLEYRNLTEYYTRKNISVSFLRSRQRGDSERVRALYGGHNDRYW
jgi:hypothetical protein